MWNIKLNSDEELETLSEDEQKAITGGQGECIHQSQVYSQGSVIKMADGQLYQCNQGTWRPYDPAKV